MPRIGSVLASVTDTGLELLAAVDDDESRSAAAAPGRRGIVDGRSMSPAAAAEGNGTAGESGRPASPCVESCVSTESSRRPSAPAAASSSSAPTLSSMLRLRSPCSANPVVYSNSRIANDDRASRSAETD